MQRDNNFNLIRAIAAAVVIISHSFALVDPPEPMELSFGFSLGAVGVKVFFAVSGYLIYKSWERSTVGEYYASRLFRLWPALLVNSLLMVFVVGPLFTHYPAYATDWETWLYVPLALSVPATPAQLPGLFIDSPHPTANGPLWTLHYEVVCYVALFLIGSINRFRYFPAWLLAFATLFWAFPTYYTLFGSSFVVGMTVAHYRHTPNVWLSIALFGVAVAAYQVGLGVTASTIAIGYAALWAGLKVTPGLRRYNVIGDFSYGLYIYAWPIQQIFRPYFDDAPVALAIVSFGATLPFAIASWHFVESPALNWWSRRRGMRHEMPGAIEFVKTI